MYSAELFVQFFDRQSRFSKQSGLWCNARFVYFLLQCFSLRGRRRSTLSNPDKCSNHRFNSYVSRATLILLTQMKLQSFTCLVCPWILSTYVPVIKSFFGQLEHLLESERKGLPLLFCSLFHRLSFYLTCFASVIYSGYKQKEKKKKVLGLTKRCRQIPFIKKKSLLMR